MEPLDLSQHPPRSPRIRLGGVTMMARTVDKLRASLPGGNLGAYKIAGFSQRLLEGLGIEEAQLREVVAKAHDDNDVAAWLAQNTNANKYDEINRQLENRRTTDMSEGFHEKYPVARKYDLEFVFDVLEYDDREMFGIKQPVA